MLLAVHYRVMEHVGSLESTHSGELRNGALQIWRGVTVVVGILPFALIF